MLEVVDDGGARPNNIIGNQNTNEPLPSHSNQVALGEFAVGNFKEFQLREQLVNLIEKYNKNFYAGANKPVKSHNDV